MDGLIVPEDLSQQLDQELIELRDTLSTKLKNILSQEDAWKDGNLIGYDDDWYHRLHGAKCYTREELQAVKTELRRRGLLVSQPNNPPGTGSKSKERWGIRRYQALIKAIHETLPDDAKKVIQRGIDIATQWEAEDLV